VTTDTIHVSGVYFNFDDTTATAVITYENTVNSVLIPVNVETWYLSGAFYATAIISLTTGQPIAVELLSDVTNIVTQIINTVGLKDGLIAGNELTILPYNIFSPLKGRI